ADSVKAVLDGQKAAAKARSADDSLLANDGKHAKSGTDGNKDKKNGGKKRGKKRKDNSGSAGSLSSPGGSKRSQVVVFVKNAIGIEPRRVKIGLTDYDYAQVVSGVEEGEQVVLLGVAQAQAARSDAQARAREKAASRSAFGATGG